jgi:hypothetical protein
LSQGDVEEQSDDTDAQEEQLHSITLRCAGSAFDRFQPVLIQLRSLGLQMQGAQLSLVDEPDNVKDKNALLVNAHFKDEDHSIGYIPVYDLPRVHNARNNGTLRDITVNRVSGKFIPLANKIIFSAYISLLKAGKWQSTKPTFKYNDQL